MKDIFSKIKKSVLEGLNKLYRKIVKALKSFITQKKNPKEVTILLLCFMVLIMGIAIATNKTQLTAKTEDYMTISLSGNVNYPGMYSVDSNTTLGELITLAGGVKEENSALDLNQVIQNSQSIEVAYPVKYVSLNSGCLEDFVSLKGVGSTLASRIISYRELHQGFQSVQELLNVKGITQSIYEANKDILTL